MKAMLEVEMPEGCYDCQFCAGTECGVVEGMPTIDMFGEEDKKPQWCPLIPEEIMDNKLLTGWIPVSKQLPKGKGYELKIDEKTLYLKVLVQTTSFNIHIAHYNTVAWFDDDGNELDVIYWMPLPKLRAPEEHGGAVESMDYEKAVMIVTAHALCCMEGEEGTCDECPAQKFGGDCDPNYWNKEKLRAAVNTILAAGTKKSRNRK